MHQKANGVIAAGHQKTVDAGIEMFRLGGNAFDAVSAAMLASFVVEPTLTSAGGGGFLLAHTQANKNVLFDFFAQTPFYKKALDDLDFYPIELNFGDAVQDFHIGLGSMAVPGNLRGVFVIQQKLGRLPFAAVAEPAIHYAENGVELSSFQSFCFKLLEPVLVASSEGRRIFAPQGKLLQMGDRLVMKDFAATLTHLVQSGPREFYEGVIAQQLVKDCRDRGGHLTLEDLKSYRVLEREPLVINYRGNTFLTNPPPSSGGALIAFALELLSRVNLAEIGFGTPLHLKILTQVMRLTNEARKDGYDANIYQTDIAKTFLAAEHLAQYEHKLTESSKWGSTTHISVIDNEGNAASATTTSGEGSSYIIPGTGIMVNNILGEADLNPQGFHQWQPNRRISSMMAPTLVLQHSQPEIVLGSGGSNRIRTAILQVISNIVDFQMPVESAVNSPRLHWENKVLSIEPGFNQQAVASAAYPGDQVVLWKRKNMFFGGVHTVRELSSRFIEGAGDQRRDGAVGSCG